MASPSPEELRASFANTAMLMSVLAENAAHIARAKRALYDAYLSEGFTEQQALELAKAAPL